VSRPVRRPVREVILGILFRVGAFLSSIVNILLIPEYISRQAYGIYSFATSRVITTFTTIQEFSRFWIFREESYGYRVLYSGLLFSILLASLSYIVTIVVLVTLYSLKLHLALVIGVLAAIFVLFDFMLTTCNVYAPHNAQLLIFIVKILQASIVVILILTRLLDVFNLILLITVCYLTSLTVGILKFRKLIFSNRSNIFTDWKRWFKKYQIPLMSILANIAYVVDAYFITYIVGFSVVSGFFLSLSISYNIFSIFGSTFMGMISLLIITRDIEKVKAYTYIIASLTIPTYIFLIIFSKYVLYVYGLKYVQYSTILQILSIYGLTLLFLKTIRGLSLGIDVSDVEVLQISELSKTSAYKVQFYRVITSITYLVLLIPCILTISTLYNSKMLTLVIWSSLLVARNVLETSLIYLMVFRKIEKEPLQKIWNILLKPTLKFLAISLTSILILYKYLNYITKLFTTTNMINTIINLALLYTPYITLTLTIEILTDTYLRTITKAILHKIIRQTTP